MGRFTKVPIWVVILIVFVAGWACACLELEPFTSSVIIAIALVTFIFPKIPLWVLVALSSGAAAFCAFYDFAVFQFLAVFAMFVLFFYKLVDMALKSAQKLGAKLLNKGAREIGQYEGDDPAGLGKPYVWNGKPAESEKGKKSGGDWLL